MTSAEAPPEVQPIGNLTIVYLGPVAPHWEIHTGFGDPQLLEDFKTRALFWIGIVNSPDKEF